MADGKDKPIINPNDGDEDGEHEPIDATPRAEAGHVGRLVGEIEHTASRVSPPYFGNVLVGSFHSFPRASRLAKSR